MPPRRKPRHVERQTLREVTDRELMEVIVSVEDQDGKVDSRAVADMFQMTAPNAIQCVGARMAWMKRWGFVRRDKQGLWSVTRKGRELINVRVEPERLRMMAGMDEASWCATVSAVAQRPKLSKEAERMAKREWIHYTIRRAS